MDILSLISPQESDSIVSGNFDELKLALAQ